MKSSTYFSSHIKKAQKTNKTPTVTSIVAEQVKLARLHPISEC